MRVWWHPSESTCVRLGFGRSSCIAQLHHLHSQLHKDTVSLLCSHPAHVGGPCQGQRSTGGHRASKGRRHEGLHKRPLQHLPSCAPSQPNKGSLLGSPLLCVDCILQDLMAHSHGQITQGQRVSISHSLGGVAQVSTAQPECLLPVVAAIAPKSRSSPSRNSADQRSTRCLCVHTTMLLGTLSKQSICFCLHLRHSAVPWMEALHSGSCQSHSSHAHSLAAALAAIF
mmetsp:Transcript_19560/g.50810  ORF Transcript_19560/g.50810 Transcript_19560/m.50810 type:complete len:227 (+) Transcript_19560:943-1623(+)